MTYTTRQIQEALIAAGFPVGRYGADGRKGKDTDHAIRRFQLARGLAVDGKVGPNTEAALFPDTVPDRETDLPTFKPSPERGQWPLQKDCPHYYGGVGLNQTTLVLPFAMRLAWDKKVVVNKFSVHEKVHDSAARAFDQIAKEYNEGDRANLGIDLFGGCLNVRKMRGGSSYSMHSWGIAIDFDPERNQLKWGRDKARLAKPDAEAFWRAWEAEGWVSLGRESNRDFMHIQAARLK